MPAMKKIFGKLFNSISNETVASVQYVSFMFVVLHAGLKKSVSKQINKMVKTKKT